MNMFGVGLDRSLWLAEAVASRVSGKSLRISTNLCLPCFKAHYVYWLWVGGQMGIKDIPESLEEIQEVEHGKLDGAIFAEAVQEVDIP